jgi:glycosyltransferase involved in cell wall biosynthesis
MKRLAVVVMNEYVWCSRTQRSAEALAREFRVKVFARAEEGKSYPIRHNGIRLDYLALLTRHWPKYPWVQAFKYIEYCVRTFFRVLDYRPDIVYCHDVYTLPVAAVFKLLGKKVVYDAHEYWADTSHKFQENAQLYRWLFWLQGITVRHFDLVITVGHCLADLMVRDHRISRPLIVPNTCIYEEVPPDPSLWKRFGIPENTYLVLYQGFLDAERGLEELVKSVSAWNPGAVLIMQGDGPTRIALGELARTNGVSDRIFFTGMVPECDVVRYARACSVGVMPYKATNLNFFNVLPNKFFAYTINRRPVLASHFPQMRMLIGEFGLGLTFDPDSPADIARAVNQAMKNRIEITEANHRRFVNEYSWQATAIKLLDAVSALISPSGKSSRKSGDSR